MSAAETGYPRIRVSGDARERSRQYGERARDRIAVIREGYERAFAAKGIDWRAATAIARRHLPAVERHLPGLLTEIEGIAEGSGLPVDDVLTINCRSEVLNSATRDAGAEVAAVAECTSAAIEAERSAAGEPLVAQNWDWLETLEDGVILLEVERPDGPDFVTLVEAGLLAKIILTASGLAVGVNTLVSSLDATTPGVPYHFQIRSLADAPHASGAVEQLARLPRATSGNYLLADESGAVLNVESSPGGPGNLAVTAPVGGTLAHANHFTAPVPGGHDLAVLAMPDSFVRLGRMRRALRSSEGAIGDREVRAALADHAGRPNSLCCHPDPAAAPEGRWKTLASVILRPRSRRFSLAAGPACEQPWREIDYAEQLAAP